MAFVELVFISYARADRAWAERLDRELSALGHACWRDIRDLRDGEDFTGEIESAIRRSSHFVVCLTTDVAERADSFVRREIQYALNRSDRSQRERGQRTPLILPIVMPGGELPVNIATHTATFVTGNHDFAAAVTGLSQRINRRGPDGPVAVAPPESPRTRYLRDLHDGLSQILEQTVQTLLTLGIVSTPDAAASRALAPVMKHFTISQVLEPKRQTPSTEVATLAEAFAGSGGRLLLLGAPGAGKTSTLLAFARDMTVAALEDPSRPIPVLANIKSWNGEQRLRDWVLEQNKDFPVLRDERLLYMLDGLDELVLDRSGGAGHTGDERQQPRAEFLERLADELAGDAVMVTSRIEEYRRLRKAAGLGGAVTLQPLTTAQIRTYLEAMQRSWLWDLAARDPALLKLAETPLLLALLVVSFSKQQEVGAGDLAGLTEAAVFDRYVSARFAHEQTRAGSLPFDESETRRRLADMATEIVWIFDERRSRAHREPAFLEFASRMHFIRQLEGNDYDFIHLRLRDFFALPRLREVLPDLDDDKAVGFAILAEQIGRPALPLLAAALDHRDPKVRRRAVLTLQDIGGPAVVPLLLKAKSDPEKNVRWDIDRYLDAMGDEAVPAYVSCMTAGDSRVRFLASERLQRANVPPVSEFIAALEDDRADVRANAISSLAAVARRAESLRASLPTLLTPFLRDPDEHVRARAARAFEEIGDVDSGPALVDLLSDPAPYVRTEAARSLAGLKYGAATPALIGLLSDADARVRGAAGDALAGLPNKDALAAALMYVRTPAATFQDDGRHNALETLSKRTDVDTEVLTALFVEILGNDPNSLVREYGAYGLKRLNAMSALGVLKATVSRDNTLMVKYAAFDAVIAMDETGAESFATEVLESDDLRLAAAAAEFLIPRLKDRAAPLIARQVSLGRSHHVYHGETYMSELGRAITEQLRKQPEAWARKLLETLPWR
jgi:HEAT repeat protein